ncbi:MAG: cation:dicarboxylase symporter family transporter [Eubacteriales bacterium]|nr:cation:dicarboxylase symporter family transporter [Eubacteriales bacterium]
MAQKIKAYKETAALNTNTIDHFSDLTVNALREAETDQKDIVRLRLAVEETLGYWLSKSGEGTTCSFRAGTRLRRHYIEIKAPGEKTGPAEIFGEDEYYGDFLYTNLISQAVLRPVYSYKDGVNCITMNPPRRMRVGQVTQILIGIILAVLFGFLSRMLPTTARNLINGIVNPLFDTMMGALQALSSPMIFLAICGGIISIGDITILGKIGRTVIGRMLIFTGVIEIITCAALMLTGLFPLGDTFQAGESGAFAQIYEMILDVVPSDMLSPFLNGNALQIIFLGVCIGIALLVLGEKVSTVMTLVDQLNGILQFLMSAIGKLVPLFVFLSVYSMIASDSFEDMGGAIKCVPLTIIGSFLCIFLYALAISLRLKVSLPLLLKKLFPTFIIALSTASGASAYGTNLETCEKKLGISSKINNFALPLGQVIFMPGAAIGFLATALCMAENSGVSITIPWLVISVVVCSLLSMAAPPVPGGSMTCYTIIFMQLGIPMSALPLAIAVNLLLEFPMTAANISSLQCELTLASAKLDMLDLDMLRN